MKDYFKEYLSDEKWLIREDKWDPALQTLRETQFTLGNGFICSRGILEEIPYDAYPGTYMAGVFDSATSQVPELVNLPNPINFRISTDGEKIAVGAMDVMSHERILDMGKGILFRRTNFMSAKKKSILYQSVRFFSMGDKNIAAMQIYLTALNKPMNITIMAGVDVSTTNKGVLTEGRKQHYRVDQIEDGTMHLETLEKKARLIYRTQLEVRYGGKKKLVPREAYNFHIKKGATVCFTLKLYIGREGRKEIRLPKSSFRQMAVNHIEAWKTKWKMCNVDIAGDPEMDKAVRFNIYNMIITAPEKGNSVGAKALSGEGYRGHVFWDAEIFLMPFYLYVMPEAARSMLIYRYNRLEAARIIAREKGFQGAMFPWESADTGFESTPTWYKDLDGTIIRIHTNDKEHHITADIAYAVYKYWQVSGDTEFMLNYGLEMILETARFWASRLEKRSIKNVIGPDEFHIGVNNNAYTNVLARWNLEMGIFLYNSLKKRHQREVARVAKKIRFHKKEMGPWKKMVHDIYVPVDKKKKLIEQFSGYFKLKDVKITSVDSNLMPKVPKGVVLSKIGETKLVKQADVVMLLHLLPDMFDDETRKVNYEYYDKRTLHKSSLSPSAYACTGARVGSDERAYQYLIFSAVADLKDIHHNTGEGIHAASCGGTWQALISGFCGMWVRRGLLEMDPRLPDFWKSVRFKIKWRGVLLKFNISQKKVEVVFSPGKKKAGKLRIRVYNSARNLSAYRKYVFNRDEKTNASRKKRS